MNNSSRRLNKNMAAPDFELLSAMLQNEDTDFGDIIEWCEYYKQRVYLRFAEDRVVYQVKGVLWQPMTRR